MDSRTEPAAAAPPLEPFQQSAALSLGVELELQLVNTHDYDLAPYSDEMLRLMAKIPLPGAVVPEMTSSMIEVSTGVCHSCTEVLGQLTQMRDALVRCADRLNIACVGGGTHPFQQWHEQRIYDRPRFRQLSELYGYLSKQFTIFGQHVHVGCPDADTALLMLHRMSRYIPHFIALSASSPYVQGQDTQFDSARLNSVFAFPMSGRAPYTLHWDAFAQWFAKSTRTGVVKSMKDFYWDIRPKPEYGTIEIRVFDTPLSVERAAALAGFVQSLASWFLNEQPFVPQEDDYMVYTYNRFQSCRFGLDAVYVEPATGSHLPLREHILQTLRQVEPHANALGAAAAIDLLRDCADRGANDARWLRETHARERLLAEVVRQGLGAFPRARLAGKLPRMGEFDLIARYFTRPVRRSPLGVGDDCALLQPAAGMQLAVSTDLLVEGRHFLPTVDPAALGHKSLAVNLSDLAACGARPLAFALSLALPHIDERWLAGFSQGLFALADAHDCELVGGDTTRGPLTIGITVFGEVPTGQALLRSGARAGDDLWVSGTLGDARLALEAFRGTVSLPQPVFEAARARMDRPQPRVALGQALRGIASAAIDLSDGLLGDLGHVLKRSKIGATIEASCAPRLLAALRDGFALPPERIEELVFAGGDDYELAFTAPAPRRDAVLAASRACDTPVTRIGRIEAAPGLRLVDEAGRELARHFAGFDHFRA